MHRFLPILLSFTLLLTGCQPVRPIRELRIVETMGCDLAPEGAALSIYAPEPELQLRQEAASLREAMDRMRDRAASPALFFAHTRYLLAGHSLAAADLAPLLDLVGRSADMRLAVPLFLLQNGEAADAVTAGDKDRSVTQMLAALQEDMARQGTGHAFTCGEVLQSLADSGAALAAACTLEEDALQPYGYGVLKGGRCVGWIPAPEERAVDLLMQLGGHGDVRLSHATVTLEQTKLRLIPQWDGAALSGLTLSLELRAALTETDGQPGAADASMRAALETELAETVAAWAQAVLQKTQALRADALGIGMRLHEQHPARWAGIAAGWEARYPELPIRVTVSAALDRTQDLEAPLPLGGTP